MDMYLPLYFKTDHLRCLVIGGGKVAARKVEMLLAAGCSLTLIAPEIERSIQEAADRGLLRWHARKYAGGDCEGFHLVIAATPCEETNRAVSFEAERRGIPANVVDVPDLCTVIFGASWHEGPLSVSVSTGGTAPFMAAVVRDRIAEAAGGLGEWVEAAGRFRAAVRHAIRESEEKEHLYRRFVDRIRRGSPPSGMPQSQELTEWLAWLDRPETPQG